MNNLQHIKVIANNLDGVFVMVCAATPIINAVKATKSQVQHYNSFHISYALHTTTSPFSLMNLGYYSYTLVDYNLTFNFKLCILKQSHVYILYCFSLSWGQQATETHTHKRHSAQCPTLYCQLMANQEV